MKWISLYYWSPNSYMSFQRNKIGGRHFFNHFHLKQYIVMRTKWTESPLCNWPNETTISNVQSTPILATMRTPMMKWKRSSNRPQISNISISLVCANTQLQLNCGLHCANRKCSMLMIIAIVLVLYYIMLYMIGTVPRSNKHRFGDYATSSDADIKPQHKAVWHMYCVLHWEVFVHLFNISVGYWQWCWKLCIIRVNDMSAKFLDLIMPASSIQSTNVVGKCVIRWMTTKTKTTWFDVCVCGFLCKSARMCVCVLFF